MLIYILLILLCFVLFAVDNVILAGKPIYFRDKVQKILLTILVVALVLISTLRSDEVGIDTTNYHEWYDSYGNREFSYLASLNFLDEPGYAFLNILFNKIGLSWTIFKLFCSLIYIIPFILVFKRFSTNVFLSTFLFVLSGGYFFIFSTIRQGIALGLILVCILLINNKKYIFSIFAYFVAITIHSTAIIFILYYVFLFVKLKNVKSLSFICIFCAIISLIGFFALRTSIGEYALRILHKEYHIDDQTGGYLTEFFYLGMLTVFFVLIGKKDKEIFINQ